MRVRINGNDAGTQGQRMTEGDGGRGRGRGGDQGELKLEQGTWLFKRYSRASLYCKRD